MDLHTTHLPMTVFAAALGVMPHIWNGNRSRAVNDPLMRVTIYLTNHKEGFREVWLGLLFSGAIALTWLLPSLVHLSKYSEWSETHDPAVAKTCLIEWEQTVCCCMARRPTQIFGLKERYTFYFARGVPEGSRWIRSTTDGGARGQLLVGPDLWLG